MNWFKAVIGLLIVAVAAAGIFLIVYGPPVTTEDYYQNQQMFDEQDFAAAQDNDDLILINFHRPWCPPCREQKRVLNQYFIDFTGSPVVVMEIDFDSQPELVERFGAVDPTTLVLYRGHHRIWYTHNQTQRPNIYSALQEAEYHSRLFEEDE
ncbi:hypothetical protein CWE09_01105 [Aliidiomarina minuta]|uniref:Thioredoxin domain-containing protein n=1 Tax=Aliidiomarina minuta TaxID=880057 RepID=A0A432W5L6_9GAMM|nr:thioredoxin family protein [Aliidiomarina minuta]RUO25364.1 hypothetical protein CWE09_01105 [Aliidiomarina minuta]